MSLLQAANRCVTCLVGQVGPNAGSRAGAGRAGGGTRRYRLSPVPGKEVCRYNSLGRKGNKEEEEKR
jgi:ribosomal protein L15